jgi:hypothetical protein
MKDNVVRMPDMVERLILEINGHLGKAEEYRKASIRDRGKWCEEIAATCIAVTALKAQFQSLVRFGKRFDESGILLNKNERAAAIAMGQEIELTKKVLSESSSWSIEGIYEKEFRFQSARKTASPKFSKRKKGIRVTPQLDKALNAYDRQKASGQTPTLKSVSEEAGTSDIPARRAATIRQVEEASLDELVLPKTAQEKFDAKLRLEVQRLEEESKIKIRLGLEERWAELWQGEFGKLTERIGRIEEFSKRKLPFSRDEFKKLLRVCHPDNSASEGLRAEVFRLLKDHEAALRPDAAAELADLARAERDRTMTLQIKKVTEWRNANGGKVRVPPEVMSAIMREAQREAKNG